MVIRRQWSFGSYLFRGNVGKNTHILVTRIQAILGPNLILILVILSLSPTAFYPGTKITRVLEAGAMCLPSPIGAYCIYPGTKITRVLEAGAMCLPSPIVAYCILPGY
jgi:hypothetical protein